MTTPEMVIALRNAGVAFDEDTDGDSPGLWLNVGDTFAYACADVEQVDESAIPEVYTLWKQHGWEGVVWWVWRKRQTEPIREIKEAVLKKMGML